MDLLTPTNLEERYVHVLLALNSTLKAHQVKLKAKLDITASICISSLTNPKAPSVPVQSTSNAARLDTPWHIEPVSKTYADAIAAINDILTGLKHRVSPLT